MYGYGRNDGIVTPNLTYAILNCVIHQASVTDGVSFDFNCNFMSNASILESSENLIK